MLLSDSSNSPDKPAASALLTANPLLRYGVALLAVAVTLLARWLLEPVLHHSAQLLLFTLAITVSAWYGGLGPGLVSTALSLILGVYFFIEPHYSFVVADPRDLVQLWMFVVIGMSISLLNHALRSAQCRAESSRAETLRHLALRNEMEESLRAAHQRLAFHVENSPLAVIEWDGNFRVSRWSQAAERLFGWKDEEVLGKRPDEWKFIYEEDAAEVNQVITDLISNSKKPSISFNRNYTKDGQVVYCEWYNSALADTDGKLVSVLSIVHDITERKRVEERVRESEERYRIVAETASDAIITIDEDSTILFVNRAAERIFGYTTEELLGQSLTMLMPEDMRHRHREGMKRYVASGEKHIPWKAVKLPGLDKNGQQIFLELSFGEFTRDGKHLFTGIARDITERTQNEQRQAAQYAVTRALAESPTLDAAAPKVLQAVCESLKWQLGAIWIVDRRELRCVQVWHAPSVEAGQFEAASRELTFSRGTGLPGRIWASGEPLWVRDVTKDTSFPRAFAAAKEGLHGAFGFPIRLGRHILGVVEFFSREIREPDQNLLEWASTIGSQIGQYIERIQVEEEKRVTEERFRLLVEGVQDYAIFMLDQQGHIVSWNYGAERINGYRAEEIIGKHFSCFYTAEDIERSYPQYELKIAEEKGRYEDEGWRVRKDGSRFWANVVITALRDEGGRLRGFSKVSRDITERKRAEEALKFLAEASSVLASSLDYQTTLTSLTRLAVPTLADWCVVDMVEENQTIRRLAVAHEDPSKVELAWELYRKYPQDMSAPEGVAKVIRTGQAELYVDISDELLVASAHTAEHLRLLRDLGLRSAMVVPLTAGEHVLGAITFVSAESGRRYSSADLSFAEELARRAAFAVDNARLYRQAQEVNRAKDEFLATLSHELRTPLTPIIGWTHMMQSGMLPATDFKHGLKIIGNNAQALTRLINDLLDMSAILSGKMRIEQHAVKLNTAVQEAVDTVSPLAAARGITIDLTHACDNTPLIVSGDRGRLVQIFWNLLSNAVKFSKDGGHVRVTCESTEAEARIHIEDQGRGISADFLPHVFDRFRQADSSRTREHGGLGLGLALVKTFVEAHGGTITAASEGIGRGSRFTVSLPRLQPTLAVSASTQNEQATHTAHSCNDTPSAAKARILIVEDVPDTLEMLRVAFESRGYEVTLCESAADALRAAASICFDIVVSDVGLPEMDGYQLLKRLRMQEHLWDVPAVALTGYARQSDVEAALKAGFDAHIAKPVDLEPLVERVEQLLNQRTPQETSGVMKDLS